MDKVVLLALVLNTTTLNINPVKIVPLGKQLIQQLDSVNALKAFSGQVLLVFNVITLSILMSIKRNV
jgi:DNA repair protein RadC